jgi:hypothetical protein
MAKRPIAKLVAGNLYRPLSVPEPARAGDGQSPPRDGGGEWAVRFRATGFRVLIQEAEAPTQLTHHRARPFGSLGEERPCVVVRIDRAPRRSMNRQD